MVVVILNGWRGVLYVLVCWSRIGGLFEEGRVRVFDLLRDLWMIGVCD